MSPRLLTAAAIAALAPALASASERHFTYTYESAVLPQGAKEIEIWSTWRRGRAGGFYSAMDNRAEYEVGVTDTFQVAIYLNTKRETVEDAAGDLQSESTIDGFSLELKHKIWDAAVDPFGFAGYCEISAASDEAEIELKGIADKLVGSHLLAINATYELADEYQAHGGEIGHQFEGELAYAYYFSPDFSLGLEARNVNLVDEAGDWTSSTLFVGPAAHYALNDWWITATWMPQVTAFKGETDGSGLDLENQTRYEIRLIGGLHL